MPSKPNRSRSSRLLPSSVLAAVALAGLGGALLLLLLPIRSSRTSGTSPGVSSPGPLPRSRVGTEVDGELVSDAHGHFVPNAPALALFAYFYTATCEEPEATIRARIVHEIRARLTPPARGEAIAALDRYRGLEAVDSERAARAEAEAPYRADTP